MNAPGQKSPFGGALVLGRVEDLADPEGLGRVRVAFPLDDAGSAEWAPVAVPFAGPDYGAYFIPDVGDTVVIAFLNNDARAPIVLGSIWHGQARPPESMDGDSADRWVLKGKAKTRIAIEESDRPTVTIETPGGARIKVTDEGGGTVKASTGGSSVTLTPSEVSIKATTVAIDASVFELTSSVANFHTPMAAFDTIITSQICQTTTVIASTYTPGAGNML